MLLVGPLLLGGANQLCAAVDDDAPPPAREWVRTVDGWEPLAALSTRPRREPALHPLTFAAFELLGAIFLLFAFERTAVPRGRRVG